MQPTSSLAGILELGRANELCHISFSMVRRSHQTQMSCSRRPRPKHRCSPQAPHNFYRTRTRKHKAYRDKLTTTPCALWTWKARRRSSTEAHSDVPTHLRKNEKLATTDTDVSLSCPVKLKWRSRSCDSSARVAVTKNSAGSWWPRAEPRDTC